MVDVSTEIDEKFVNVATCVLNEKYIAVSADENYYNMIGSKSLYPVNKFVHPDEKKEFEEYVFDVTRTDSIVVRMCLASDRYRLYVVNRKDVNNSYKDDLKVQLTFCDLVERNAGFSNLRWNVQKYRLFMTHFECKFFEYDYGTGMFEIYYYVGGHSEIYEKDLLDNWHDNVIKSGYVDKKEVIKFDRICEDIKEEMDTFSVSLKTSLFSRSSRVDNLVFSGELFIDKDNIHDKVMVGVIYATSGKNKEISIGNTANQIGNIDSSTGLLNKKAVTDDITGIIEKSVRDNDMKTKYMLVIDIDDFKSVNDTYGHQFGDQVIKVLADGLTEYIGDKGLTGRIGGDEFICFLTECESEDSLRILVKAIRNKIKLAVHEKNPSYDFTLSVGVSAYPSDGKDYNSLFKIADGCLYIAKEKGKDRYIIYRKELHEEYISAAHNFSERRIGIDFMKPMDKCVLAADLAIALSHSGKDGIKNVLNELVDRMNIHGIRVFEGKTDMHILHEAGRYSGEQKSISFVLEEKYMSMFDEYNINTINNVASLALDYKEAYEYMKKFDICSTLQILNKKKDGSYRIICFDTFGQNRRKWSVDDKAVVLLVTRIIADVW